MPSKSISISNDVYKLLDKYRMKNESFSQAIKRLLESKTNLMELAGGWKKIPDSDSAIQLIEKIVNKIHNEEADKIKLL